jgi:hypothetical protein
MQGFVWIPIDPADVSQLEAKLTEWNPFVTTAVSVESPYALQDYVLNTVSGGEPVSVLLDRNLVSRAVRLVRRAAEGSDRPPDETDLVAAACMAFWRTAGVSLEPNLSLYELAATTKDADASTELAVFRTAEVVHPQAWLDVALGRTTTIYADALDMAMRVPHSEPTAPSAETFNERLRRWKIHRCVLTKVALLEKSAGSKLEKYKQLLQWSATDGVFDGSGLAFASHFFGTRAPARRMIRGLRSANPQQWLDGIDNAAWDLTYISYWTRQAKRSLGNGIWILCTADTLCADIARRAVAREGDERRPFDDVWTKAEAAELRELHQRLDDMISQDPNRPEEAARRMERIDDVRQSLAAELLQHAPNERTPPSSA